MGKCASKPKLILTVETIQQVLEDATSGLGVVLELISNKDSYDKSDQRQIDELQTSVLQKIKASRS